MQVFDRLIRDVRAREIKHAQIFQSGKLKEVSIVQPAISQIEHHQSCKLSPRLREGSRVNDHTFA